MQSVTAHHKVLIVGGGTAGISVAARLRRRETDIAVIEPSDKHYYQPLWTLVGGGLADPARTVRPEGSVIPKGVTWIRDRVIDIDPANRTVTLGRGGAVGYDQLVVAPGVHLDWAGIPGLTESVGHDGVSSNYRFDLAPRTWEFIREVRGGTALFTMPPGPIKCGGAPQKIAYLAADWWHRQGVLDRMRVILVLPTATIFVQPDWAAVLEQVAAGYGIEIRYESQLAEIDGVNRQVALMDNRTGNRETVRYDVLHVVPPHTAPQWVRQSPLADPASPFGYVEVDRHTLRSPRWPEVFALGDVANLPTSKTGAAIRKQVPVVVANLLAAGQDRPLPARYDGYTSCPLVTARDRMLLAEFDYAQKPQPSFPFIDTMKPRYDMWLLKKYGLPALYWHGMLRGRL